MKKILKEEINRYRELMGVSLLSEGINPRQLLELLGNILGKNTDEITTLMKSGADEFASLRGLRNFDTLIDDLVSGNITDDALDEIVGVLIKEPKFENKIVDAFLSSNDVLKQIDDTFSDTEALKNLVGAVDDAGNPLTDNLINQIDNLDIGEETKKYFKEKINKNIDVAKKQLADAQKLIDDDAAKKLAEEISKRQIQEAIAKADEALKVKIENAKKLIDNFVEDNPRMKGEKRIQSLKAEIEKAFKENPNGDMSSLFKSQKEELNNILIQLNKIDEQDKDKLIKFWSKVGKTTKDVLLRLVGFNNISTGAQNKVVGFIKYYLTLSLIGGAAITGYKIWTSTELTSEEGNEILDAITYKLGECVNKNTIRINWKGTIFPSMGDVFSADEDDASITVKINGEDETLKYDEDQEAFVKIRTREIINCKNTPGLGVEKTEESSSQQNLTAPTEDEFKTWWSKQKNSEGKSYAAFKSISINNATNIVTGTATNDKTFNYKKIADGEFQKQ